MHLQIAPFSFVVSRPQKRSVILEYKNAIKQRIDNLILERGGQWFWQPQPTPWLTTARPIPFNSRRISFIGLNSRDHLL
ncbi:MAG: hypothetical protein O2960_06455 [Verrucomicrobia bacterium]|nr:hypothetical protein [Verrucomicrobiota bacterium]